MHFKYLGQRTEMTELEGCELRIRSNDDDDDDDKGLVLVKQSITIRNQIYYLFNLEDALTWSEDKLGSSKQS